MGFIPEVTKAEKVPYFEDLTSENGGKGHSTNKSERILQSEIAVALSNLGAFVGSIVEGKYADIQTRHGYQIYFSLRGVPGRIDVAALPLRKPTPAKVSSAKRHALFTVRDMLVAQYNASLLQPGIEPLLPYLILGDGRTITETLKTGNLLPATVNADSIEGEIVEFINENE